MRSFLDFSKDDGEILGPGTDLVISLVAILMVLLAINMKELKISKELNPMGISHTVSAQKLKDCQGELERLKDSIAKLNKITSALSRKDLLLKKIRESQMTIISQIARTYNTSYDSIGNNKYTIRFKNMQGQSEIIKIKNDATLQRISFGNSTLFSNNKDDLKYSGKKVLRNVGLVFKNQLQLIKDIQIQGHADVDKNSLKDENDNLNIAAVRAIRIVRYFRDDIKLDPAKHILYASSFGYYMPVERDYSNVSWDMNRIIEVNKEGNGNQNRRVEIVINYKEGRD